MADILEARNERLFDRVFLHNHIKRDDQNNGRKHSTNNPFKERKSLPVEAKFR